MIGELADPCAVALSEITISVCVEPQEESDDNTHTRTKWHSTVPVASYLI